MLSHHPDYKPKERCGCGSDKSRFDFVPDNILGLSIKEACCPHDDRYERGGTQEDKDFSDLEFHGNMLKIIDNYKLANQVGKWNKIKCAIYPHLLARHIATGYYDKVIRFGDSSFNFREKEVNDND